MMDLVGVFGTHGLVAHENACQHRCERKKKNERERESTEEERRLSALRWRPWQRARTLEDDSIIPIRVGEISIIPFRLKITLLQLFLLFIISYS